MTNSVAFSTFFASVSLRIEVVPKNQQHQSLLFSAAGAAAPKKSGKQDLASFLEDGDDEKPDICWLLCAGQELKCPEGWVSFGSNFRIIWFWLLSCWFNFVSYLVSFAPVWCSLCCVILGVSFQGCRVFCARLG